MEGVSSSEITVMVYQTTHCHISEDSNLYRSINLLFVGCNSVLAAYSVDKSVAHRHKRHTSVDHIYCSALWCLVHYLYWRHHDGPWGNAWH